MTLQSLASSTPHSIWVKQIEIGPHQNFAYLLGEDHNRSALLVDAPDDRDNRALCSFLETEVVSRGYRLTGILLTHAHPDHIAGLRQAIEVALPRSLASGGHQAQNLVYLHAEELNCTYARTLLPEAKQFQLLEDQQTLPFGAGLIRILHTPGHSPGHLCFALEGEASAPPRLFTGDTVFVRSAGRTDFERGDRAALYASIQKIKELDPRTVIYPGHHYEPELTTTLRSETTTNWAFRARHLDEFWKGYPDQKS